MAIFKGAGVAIVTPMKDNGEINYEVLGALIEDQIANHTDAIIICGTSGEAPTLEDDEHLEAIRYTVEKTAGRIPVIAGTGSNNTAHAVMMSKEAQQHGADGETGVGIIIQSVGNVIERICFLPIHRILLREGHHALRLIERGHRIQRLRADRDGILKIRIIRIRINLF